jgi:hypothetical protein
MLPVNNLDELHQQWDKIAAKPKKLDEPKRVLERVLESCPIVTI